MVLGCALDVEQLERKMFFTLIRRIRVREPHVLILSEMRHSKALGCIGENNSILKIGEFTKVAHRDAGGLDDCGYVEIVVKRSKLNFRLAPVHVADFHEVEAGTAVYTWSAGNPHSHIGFEPKR